RQALRSAGRLLKETNCQAVKLEGGRPMARTITALVQAGIPVMGHVGLQPQAVRRLGGYKVQRSSEGILTAPPAGPDAGGVAGVLGLACVVECTPSSGAEEITDGVSIPTMGMGAGPRCDGQVLVVHDMLGLIEQSRPKFVRHYAELGQQVRAAVAAYVADVA